ncbi:hypothetical protein, partial [Bifidobacterium pullorum]|uniref:hypothetical protein n=1 Tax=Bifidobacterium pullorum TaxID=78448 RepID=UPI001956CB51
LKENPHWKGCRRILEKTEMREWSIVSVPACPDALMEKGGFKGLEMFFTKDSPVAKPRFKVVPPLELTKPQRKFLTADEACV